MPKKVKLSDMNEHLFEMAERLLNDIDICVDEETTKREVSRANALVGVANAVVSLKEVELHHAETEIKMVKVAEQLGRNYIPKIFEDAGTENKLIESKKKL